MAGQGCYFASRPLPQEIDGRLKGRIDGPRARSGAVNADLTLSNATICRFCGCFYRAWL